MGRGAGVNRFEVYLVRLDPTVGKEIKKSRPCAVISPDELNDYMGTVIVAPMTTRRRRLPSRVQCRFKGTDGEIALDHIRSVDKSRLRRRLGQLGKAASRRTLEVLQEMFAP